jgi:hypothetical protein
MWCSPILLESIVLLVSCFSQDSPQSKQQADEQKRFEESSLISTTATVEAIDYKARTVTVRGPEGNTSTIKCCDSVKRLDEVKAGDRIIVDYYESFAMQVVKMGTAESGKETVVDTSEPGEKPAQTTTTKTTLIATVEAIDRTVPSITLKGQKGNLIRVKVRHPERLKLVRIGDTLKITFLEALAISVQPAPKEAH